MKFSKLVVLSFLVLLAPEVLAWKVYHAPNGKVLHWERDSVTMIGDLKGTRDVPGNAEWQAVVASMETWNAVDCDQPQLRFGGLKKDVVIGYWPDRQNYNAIRWVNNKKEWTDRYGDLYGDVIAFTTVSYNQFTGEILDADMEINDWNFFFTVSDDPRDTKFDVHNTVTHELGHVLGLDHSLDGTATMYYSAEEQDLNKRTLEEDDIEGLCFIYKQKGIEPIPDTPSDEGNSPSLPMPPTPTGNSVGCTGSSNPGPFPWFLGVTILLWTILRRVLKGGPARSGPS